ncbi:hypothetical protein [Streptomyces sparsogenes]|uniref:hypothetical protein n=1 Tax=Streptomyces sparsogenes TaxID=67365 RepID=UPI0033F5A558
MHGHAPAPPPRPATTATVVVLRVVFVAVTLLSLGFLSWVTMLRVAILRRRALDWLLFWTSCVLVVLAFVEFGTGPDEPDALAYTTLAGVFLLACGVTTHYLIVDIRHHRPARPGTPAVAPYVPPGYPPAAYGYPAAPHQPVPHQPMPSLQPQQPLQPQPPQPRQPLRPHAQPQHQPQPYPQPQAQPQAQAQPQPQHQRIRRVRAELDELSDYLRREEGR